MKNTDKAPVQESPARRLGVLYIASLTAITVLSAIGQTFILRELSFQSQAIRSMAVSAQKQAMGRSLSIPALAIQAASDHASRRQRIETFRETLNLWRDDEGANAPEATVRGNRRPRAEGFEQWVKETEPHRRAAIEAGTALLAAIEADPEASPGSPTASSLVKTIVAEEEAAFQAVGDRVAEAEQEAATHILRLQRLECVLFGFVMMVLLMEGLFVITPAVRNIQNFMADMTRSHEEVKSYAARLERSNKELQDFASVASHDLQEPLRKVQAFGDRLKIKYAAVLDDQGRDYLERIQNAARRMQTLINDLLTFSRVTTKAQPFVPTNLSTATREVVSDLEVRIEQVKGQVDIGPMPTIEADPLQIRQLMQNLIGNALKYHKPEEPPMVKVTSHPIQGTETTRPGEPSREFCQITVEDNGIGFEEIYSERIFTIFQRLHGRSEYEGTGVGLAVCRKIVERHGGSISARSTPGKGSTFLVTLPVRQARESSDGTAH